ncbi:hypothetical protein ISS97_05110 [Dyella koreensis]|uniref:Pyosin/cloacin translocation domain-containing protein n=1 Tax=Dyella koreensis TaxID=311235 RepID=A0ABW8K145_9GAMM
MFNWFKKRPGSGPDFSHVDSREKAEELYKRGQLEKVCLMPLEFGGADFPPNIVYLPPGISEIKAGIDKNVIAPLAANGTIRHYSATPEYEGRSFIPIAINVKASDPGNFSTTINVWGSALHRNTLSNNV